MAFLRLEIKQFRNLLSVNLKPLECGFNIFYGNNGSGKTSLIEAIHYLTRGRSFRSSLINRLIHFESDYFSLFGELLDENNCKTSLGLERNTQFDMQIRINGQNVDSISEIAQLIPIQLIHSHSHLLLETPHFRRKYLDWGVFYSSPRFLSVWKRFQKALKQRNAALRNQLSFNEIDVWTQEVVETGVLLDQMRQLYIQNLKPLLEHIIEDLLAIKDLRIDYLRGWDSKIPYKEYLAQTLEKDRLIGHTQQGPHRADFKIIINGVPAKDILSRGQQKLFVCAMIVAQGILLKNDMNKKPIYLVDDLPSELDSVSRIKLLSLLSKQNTQIFVTTVERTIMGSFLAHHPTKMFHVEQGRVDEVNERHLPAMQDC